MAAADDFNVQISKGRRPSVLAKQQKARNLCETDSDSQEAFQEVGCSSGVVRMYFMQFPSREPKLKPNKQTSYAMRIRVEKIWIMKQFTELMTMMNTVKIVLKELRRRRLALGRRFPSRHRSSAAAAPVGALC